MKTIFKGKAKATDIIKKFNKLELKEKVKEIRQKQTEAHLILLDCDLELDKIIKKLIK